MKRFQFILAKETGHPSGGKDAGAGPVAAQVAAAAGPPWQPVATCPMGTIVRVRSADGKESKAVRSEYVPNWQDENRDKPLAFTPAEWAPLV